jgi:hypothetical protein
MAAAPPAPQPQQAADPPPDISHKKHRMSTAPKYSHSFASGVDLHFALPWLLGVRRSFKLAAYIYIPGIDIEYRYVAIHFRYGLV